MDAYGHVSVRSEQNPQHYFMSRALAPELVTADDILEYDLDCKVIGASALRFFWSDLSMGKSVRRNRT